MFWETIQVQHVAKIHVIVVPLDRPPDIVVVRAHLVTDYLVQGRARMRLRHYTDLIENDDYFVGSPLKQSKSYAYEVSKESLGPLLLGSK